MILSPEQVAEYRALADAATDLKTCPFCGAPAQLEEEPPNTGVFRFTVACGGNACPITSVCAVGKTAAEVIGGWNTRAEAA